MENSTKALLIAGAVLVVILVITMGISLFSKTKTLPDTLNDKSKKTSVTYFNRQFEQYFGEDLPVSTVIELLNTMYVSNSKNPDRVVRATLSRDTDLGVFIGNMHDQYDPRVDNKPFENLQKAILDRIEKLSHPYYKDYRFNISPNLKHKCIFTDTGKEYDSEGYIRCLTILKVYPPN